jgi:hypothetical protein
MKQRQNQRNSQLSKSTNGRPLIKRAFRPATTGIPQSIERPFNKNPNIIRGSRWITSACYPQTAESPSAFNFKLSSLPGYAEFTNMFDQYRITRVDVIYEPASRCGPSAPTTSNGAPHMWTQVDYDSTATVSVAELQQRENAMVHSAYDKWEHSFVPKIAATVYQSAVASGYMVPEGNPWISTQTPSVEYYGFKYAFPATASAVQFGGTLMFRVHYELKNVL